MTIEESNMPATNDADIGEFEKASNLHLPEEYRRFLVEHNGGKPSDNLLSISDCNQQALIDHFLGIARPDEDLRGWFEELKGEVPDGFLPIAFDPGGNAILLDTSDGVVYYWDSARAFSSSSDEENTYWVANSFADLLNGLKKME